MNANKAVELGFADNVSAREGISEPCDLTIEDRAVIFSQKRCDMYVTNLLTEKCRETSANNVQTTPDNKDTPEEVEPEKDNTPSGRSKETLNERMELMRSFLGGSYE